MRNVYTVGQINAYVKNMFSQDFLLQKLSVKGEVSNCKYHSTGHIYFTLKDRSGTISCVMFAGNRSGLAFRITEGMQVIVSGTVDVYERDGKYQLYAREIQQDGAGALFEKFEKLKKELAEQGMFAPEYKKPIPRYIRKLGVVTAPTGAAVRDIIQVAGRRNPYVQIILYPALVQGEGAAASIINGIRTLEAHGVDLMIVGRGGGSIEDLWAFNEECVARAVFDCSVPVISAVGHETDTTIIDYVSDLRAPTPSAAAELAVFDVMQALQKLDYQKASLNRLMKNTLEWQKMRCRNYESKLAMSSPLGKIREKKMFLLSMEEKLAVVMEKQITAKRHTLALYIEKMKGLSPLDKLSKGFVYASDAAGKAVTDVQKVSVGDELTISLKNGTLKAQVTDKWENRY
ncbi:MAG: exodeoxyribonuclease VII large subunit [Lachnospiraceae bacterium]|nr:exodeoxyribonuclease VII large subunit [Lachnospiraceae bacterium]